MPNGGYNCSGTCWFNRKNRGDLDSRKHRDNSKPHHCEIRDVAIDHPHRRPDRDPIPIGPITRTSGLKGNKYTLLSNEGRHTIDGHLSLPDRDTT